MQYLLLIYSDEKANAAHMDKLGEADRKAELGKWFAYTEELKKADVFVVQWPASALGYDFYRNMMPEVPAVPVVERAGKPAPRPPPLPTPVSLTAPCRRCPSCSATRATTSSTRRTGTWR